MKKLLLLLLLLIPGPLLAQDNANTAATVTAQEVWPVLPALPARDGKIYYEEVVELKPSVPKDSLYAATRKWLTEYYETLQPELLKENREAGQLIAQGDHHFQFYVRDSLQQVGENQQEKPYVIHLQHTLHIEVQDGQYRFRIYDFTARDEIQDLMLDQELNPAQGQVLEPRVRRSAKSKKNREALFLKASFKSKLLTGLEKEIHDLTESLKSALAKAASSY